MRVMEMVSRPSMSKAEPRNVADSQNGSTREPASTSNDRRECSRRAVVLDAFDKIILDYDYDDRNFGPT